MAQVNRKPTPTASAGQENRARTGIKLPIGADPATDYARKVIDGTYPAGPHVRNACKRHLRDLDTGHERGLRFDPEKAAHALGFFRDVLHLMGGEFEGVKFHPAPWQEFVIGSLFGWLNADGYRRFRVSFIESGKGSGKSPLAAGVGLYMLVADGEARAEIYAGASKKDQAMILFRDAVAMVRHSPALQSRLTFSGGPGREWNIAHLAKGSFFRAISADDGQSGPRPHCALLDEVHEHRDETVVEMLRAGTKGRRQALIFMITNSGVDRQSICYQYHDYTCRVCAGDIEDDAHFGYVCALDEGKTEVYDVDVSVQRMASSCNCTAKNTLIDLSRQEGFAQAVIRSFEDSETLSGEKFAQSTLIGRSFREVFAGIATKHGLQQSTRNTDKWASMPGNGMRSETAIKSVLSTRLIGNERSLPTQIGSGIAPENGGSGFRPNSTENLANDKSTDAEYAEATRPIYGLTTAILRELCADYSAIPAMRASVCSEITSKLFGLHSPTCKTRQLYRMVKGELAQDYPADDPFTDEGCWPKANPTLGVTIRHDYLREQVTAARGMPGKESIVRRLNFSQWVDATSPWVSGDLWRQCETDLDLDQLQGAACWGGLDLSGTNDLSALALVWKIDGKFKAAVWQWTPADTLAERARRDRVPYAQWVKEGHLIATPGRSVDYQFIARELGELAARFNIRGVAFDPFRIKWFIRDLDAMGVSVNLIPHGQGVGRSTESSLWMPRSIDVLEKSVLDGTLQVQRNPVLTFNSASAILESDAKGNRLWVKRKSAGRIDGIVALSMALGAADTGPESGNLDEFLNNVIMVGL